MRIASERRLAAADVELLGMLRQAFQELRQQIRDGRPLRWHSSDHPQYLKLKELAAYAASLFGDSSWHRPTREEALAAIVAITANTHEVSWTELV